MCDMLASDNEKLKEKLDSLKAENSSLLERNGTLYIDLGDYKSKVKDLDF